MKMSLPDYARSRGVSASTVRRWIRKGAPVVGAGGRGPGRAARVDPAALDDWRRGGAPRAELVARAVLDVFLRDGGDGRPLWRALGMRPAAAAALLVETYDRVARALELGDDTPAEIAHLMRVLRS